MLGHDLKEEELVRELEQAIISGNVEDTARIANEILKAELDPIKVIQEHLVSAMKLVGEKFENQEYFLADLMSAGEAMKVSTSILTSGMDRESIKRLESARSGVVVIGTVKGDQHDIGKNLVALLLQANRFDIHDLGVDVSPQEFVEKAKGTDSDIVALSALLTTTVPYQAEVTNYLRDAGLRGRFKVMVGGGATSADWAKEIGAEGWAPDATKAVEVAKQIMRVS